MTAAWNGLLLVDSPASVRGGELLGFRKRLAGFDWREGTGPGGRVEGECVVRLGGREVVRIGYRQGRVPVPGFPVRAVTIRDDMVIDLLEPAVGSLPLVVGLLRGSGGGNGWPLASPRQADPGGRGDPGHRGVMADDVRVLGFLPHRRADRTEGDRSGGWPPSPGP